MYAKQTSSVCTHAPCTCEVPKDGAHCSPECAALEGPGCDCGHAVCEAYSARSVDEAVLDPHTVGESMEAPGTSVDAGGAV